MENSLLPQKQVSNYFQVLIIYPGGNYKLCLDYKQTRRMPKTNKIKVAWKLNVGEDDEDILTNMATKDQLSLL